MPATRTSRAVSFLQPPTIPPCVPLLLSEMELFPTPSRVGVFGENVLIARPTRPRVFGVYEVQVPPVVRPAARSRADTGKKSRLSSYEKPSAKRPSPDGTGSTTSAEAEVEVEAEGAPPSVRAPIPKPFGEVGRPGRGGYNLDNSLRAIGWSAEDVSEFKTKASFAIEKHLNIAKSYSNQLPAGLQKAREIVNHGRLS
ncbi:uncharacterized protein PHACADRAFT_189155 [Phanerochaete carnosa HHB-10118-sp]|uniref:Uncharacterized protein n=1 Tax=Phanerochaete carnosa (strain HHB-10118-sp) TaxID=650164 RepID=K5VP15_PHACS|nr:uncharacterized protein PHACADRAFT_189155 [Phanerochaete carnosa HHB-10118-sp]EKM48455.1 hypothetical protein PHACADRAFT_189155 [Phanerochaete carnosa HHB-10118-sp]